MDFRRGERVNLNFDTGAVEKLEPESDHEPPTPVFPTFVGDILERDHSTAPPPTAPSLKANANGFPTHRKRIPKLSAFKRQREVQERLLAVDAASRDATGDDADRERRAIDEENTRTIASMSIAEIEQERQELMQSLDPNLLQKLLLRSNLNEGSNEQNLHPDIQNRAPLAAEKRGLGAELSGSNTKKVTFAAPHVAHDAPAPSQSSTAIATSTTDTPLEAVNAPMDTLDAGSDSIHFPAPPQPPDLDPEDPSFLRNLHDKYFPKLPYNPRELSWMAPIDPSDESSPYHPSQTALSATELRFDFKGALLAPSVARSIPSDRGLHHHAAAPEAAGYTIPELAVLARSQVAAQRCMAYQTLGRILYRLGQGEFGIEGAKKETNGPVQVAKGPEAGAEGSEDDDEEDIGSAMAAGLWGCMDEGRVVEAMTEEANKTKGHLTARTFAQEALWNWRRGGGRKRQAV